jgi:hypothetical protein
MEVPACVVLDRIEPGEPKPDYCIHGRATCIACDEWVWLGSETVEVVRSGRAAPLCKQCANRFVPPSTQPTDRIRDHRQADGPH